MFTTSQQKNADEREYELEKDLSNAVMKYLRSIKGMFPFRLIPGPHTGRRTIDILFCWKGKFGGIELKVQGRKATPNQHMFIACVRQAGGRAEVCRTLGQVKEFLAGFNHEDR